MTRLIDCFASLITLGLSLDAGSGTVAERREQALALVEAARAEAAAAGYAPATVESAVFAMVAWFDERLAERAAAAGESYEPLQLQLFNSLNAHTEFFHHLSGLQVQDDELREVYWHAL